VAHGIAIFVIVKNSRFSEKCNVVRRATYMASPRSPGMLSKADEEIKKTVESYFKQLKDGCGARSCGNEWCRSNANCAVSLVRTLGLRVLLSEHRPTRYTPIGLARTLPKSPCWPSSWRLPARRSVANSSGGQYSRANLCNAAARSTFAKPFPRLRWTFPSSRS
jgi:hypothetical protein